MTGANLETADLFYTILKNAKLKASVLAGADLTDADLTGADLTDAIVSKDLIKGSVTIKRVADFTRTKIDDAKFTGVDMAQLVF